MRDWKIYPLVTFVVLMCVACGSPTAPFFDCPKVFSIVSGNNQRAAAGTTLTSLLEVSSAVSPGRESMFCTALGPQIVWSVETGGGSIVAVSDGPRPGSTAVWTLGPTPGVQAVRATWTNTGENAVRFVLFSAVAESPQ